MDLDILHRRIAPLDGLRAFAVMPVIAFHISPELVPGGFVGVDLFFVLSGYIISRVLLNEYATTGRLSIPAFYQRRARRLLPAFLAMVLFTTTAAILLHFTGHAQLIAPMDAVAALGSFMNWRILSGGGSGGVLAHCWSLSVEEQFYLLWPLAMTIGLKGRRTTVVGLVLAILVAVAIGWHWQFDWKRSYFGSDVRAQALLLGCLLAFAPSGLLKKWPARLWPIPAATLVLMIFMARTDAPTMARGGFALAALASAWLIAVASGALTPRFNAALASWPVQWIGRRSYSLYLWHYPIIGLVVMLEWKMRYAVPLELLITFIAAALSYRWLEQGPRKTPAPPASGQPVGLAIPQTAAAH